MTDPALTEAIERAEAAERAREVEADRRLNTLISLEFAEAEVARLRALLEEARDVLGLMTTKEEPTIADGVHAMAVLKRLRSELGES